MAKAKKRSSSRSYPKKYGGMWSIKTFIFLAILLAGIVLSVVATMQSTRPFNFAACQENCSGVQSNGYWMITNCTNTNDTDGEQSLCSFAGRVEKCGGKDYCCPGPNQKWTTNMSSCSPTSTQGPTSTPRPQATQTPYPTYTPYPSATSTPRPTSTRAPTPTRRPTSTPRPTITPTPTKTPSLIDVCGKSCTQDSDCQLNLGCTTVFGTLHACRNKLCPEKPGCLCEDSTGAFVFATPTGGPNPNGGANVLPLTVGGFTDGKSQTNLQPTISGTSVPDAKISVTIYPDGIGAEVYADKNGKWSFRPTKKLTPGPKNLLVVATKDGAQGQVTKTFTAVGGGGFNFGWILLILVLAAVGFGGYVYYKSNQ